MVGVSTFHLVLYSFAEITSREKGRQRNGRKSYKISQQKEEQTSQERKNRSKKKGDRPREKTSQEGRQDKKENTRRGQESQ